MSGRRARTAGRSRRSPSACRRARPAERPLRAAGRAGPRRAGALGRARRGRAPPRGRSKRSRARRAAARRPAGRRLPLMLGPYGSDTTRACAGRGGVVWNHGAAADDVQRTALVVSVPSPASRYLVALGRAVAELRAAARVAIAAGRGRFARLAAEGLEAKADSLGWSCSAASPHRPGPASARRRGGRGPCLRPAPAGGGPPSPARGALAAHAPRRRLPGDPRLPTSAGGRPRRLPRPRPVAPRPRSRARARAAVRGRC